MKLHLFTTSLLLITAAAFHGGCATGVRVDEGAGGGAAGGMAPSTSSAGGSPGATTAAQGTGGASHEATTAAQGTGGASHEATTSTSGGTGGTAPEIVVPGDLVITEIMSNPKIITDTHGEWFELFNTTTHVIDLHGLVIRHEASDPTAVHTIAAHVTVAPQAYTVLGKDTNPQTNGGAPVAYAYPPEIGMTNEGDYLAIEAAGTIIDNTAWSGANGFSPLGASRTLDPGYLSATLNNDESHFCAGTSLMASGDRGTPGSPNDTCP